MERMERRASAEPEIKKSAGRLSRRRMLRSVTFTALGIGASGLLAACTASPPAAPTQKPAGAKPASTAAAKAPATTQPAPAPTQKSAQPGGTVTVIVNSEPPHLDVQTFVLRVTLSVADELNEYLCRYDENAKIVPSLAQQWEYADDKTVKFQLHQGVKFHNGRELVAEDVQKSFERVMDPQTGAQLRVQMENVDRVETPDKYTAVFHMKRPFAFLFDKLVHLAIYPMEELEKGNDPKTRPIGAGPFMFKEWKKDQQIELVRFPDYFREGRPKLDRLIFKPISNYASARSTLLARQADVLHTVSDADVEALKSVPQVYLQDRELANYTQLGFNTKKAPWDNLKLRQAFKYAIDRTPIIEGALRGNGKPSFASTPTNSIYYPKDIEYQRDVTRAKQLMAEAGFANGLEETFLTTTSPADGATSDILQSQLQEVGIRLKIEKMEGPTLISRVFNTRDHAIAMFGYTGPDITRLLDPYFRPDGPNNFMNYSTPKLTELLDRGSATIDDAERGKTYQEVYRIISEEAPMIHLYAPVRSTAAYQWVQGMRLLPSLQEDWSQATTSKTQ